MGFDDPRILSTKFMEVTLQLLVFSSFFISRTIPARSAPSCLPGYCDTAVDQAFNCLQIRFPFRLKDRQPDRCGYPGFDLYCNTRNQTILKLPKSGEFVVGNIDYIDQTVYIEDPGECLPERAVNFSLTGSPFRAGRPHFVFFNCSDTLAYFSPFRHYWPVRCLGDGINNTVVAATAWSNLATPRRCRRIGNGSVPLWAPQQFDRLWKNVTTSFELTWSEPAACRRCEIDGRICGYESKSGLEIGCSRASSPGFPSAKIALIIGIGFPSLIIYIIGVTWLWYACWRHQRPLDSESEVPLPATSSPVAVVGLDQPTIASFPIIILEETQSQHFPTCLICLCEYQPKEALRTIPNCNHYFHANCVDHWLSLNSTCPVCRNSLNKCSSILPTSIQRY